MAPQGGRAAHLCASVSPQPARVRFSPDARKAHPFGIAAKRVTVSPLRQFRQAGGRDAFDLFAQNQPLTRFSPREPDNRWMLGHKPVPGEEFRCSDWLTVRHSRFADGWSIRISVLASEGFDRNQQRVEVRTIVYRVVSVLAWFFGVAGAMVGAIARADTSKIPARFAWLAGGIAAIQGVTWILFPSLALGTAALIFIRKQIGEPWVWNAIHDFLDGYRSYAFLTLSQDPLHHHRVTLFRRRPAWHPRCLFRFPIGAKLLPVARSGHTTQRSAAAFAVPDDADRAQGVAGQTWARWRTIILTDLPDVYAAQVEETISDYAQKTWCSAKWVKTRIRRDLPLARSFCGVPVRVKGRHWGVIVLDSRDPTSLEESEEDFHELMGRTLGKMLERI